MKAFLFPLAVLASSAMAQTTSTCGADYIVDACLETENTKLANCKDTDYGCKCSQWVNIMTCYNNCPNDPRQFSAGGQRDIFCGYASQFPSNKATTVAVTQTGTSAAAQNTQNANTNQKATSATEAASGSATVTATGAGATKTNNAADLALNAGGVLAAVAGVAAFVL